MKNRMGEVMQKRGMTEERLAALTGIRQGNINRLKNGKHVPKVDTALRVARALRVSVEKLWSLSDRSAA